MKNTIEYKSQICKQYNLTSREYDSLLTNSHYAKSSDENRDTILEIIFKNDEDARKGYEYAKDTYEKNIVKFNELDETHKMVASAAVVDLYEGYFAAMKQVGLDCWKDTNVVERYLTRNIFNGMGRLNRLSNNMNNGFANPSFNRGFTWGKIDVKDAWFDIFGWGSTMRTFATFTPEQNEMFDSLMKAVNIGYELGNVTRWFDQFESKYNKALAEWTYEVYIPTEAAKICEEKKKASEARKAYKAAKEAQIAREKACTTIEELWDLKRPEIENWAKTKLGITDEAELERVVMATLKKHYSKLPEK